jgi:hypothetical protein
VPKSPYIAVVYRYADTMLAKGRDTSGPQKTGPAAQALDRATLVPLTNLPAAPGGVRAGDRVNGANPQHDETFLRLLYTLSELTLKPVSSRGRGRRAQMAPGKHRVAFFAMGRGQR